MFAIGGPDKQRLQKLWVDMFGLEVMGSFRSGQELPRECAVVRGKATNSWNEVFDDATQPSTQTSIKGNSMPHTKAASRRQHRSSTTGSQNPSQAVRAAGQGPHRAAANPVADAAAGLGNLTLHVTGAPDQSALLDLSEASETKGAPAALTRAADVITPEALARRVSRISRTPEFERLVDMCSQKPGSDKEEVRRKLELKLAGMQVDDFIGLVEDKSYGQDVGAMRAAVTAVTRLSKIDAAAQGRSGDFAQQLRSTVVSRPEVAEFEQRRDFAVLYGQQLTPQLKAPKFTAFVPSCLTQLRTEHRRRPVAQALVIMAVIGGAANCEGGSTAEAAGTMNEEDRVFVDDFIARLNAHLRDGVALSRTVQKYCRLADATEDSARRDAVMFFTLKVLRQMLSSEDYDAMMFSVPSRN